MSRIWKYFENALDEANADHERKMIIEGHFAGTRAGNNADRDPGKFQELYRKSYSFIALALEDSSEDNANPQDWQKKSSRT